MAIKAKRLDLRLHGFGLKKTALKSGLVRSLLYSADSQAHSFGSTGQRKFANASNPLIAKKYAEEILNSPVQLSLLGEPIQSDRASKPNASIALALLRP